ncbi:MAG: helix-turn-helix transcriptional regulator [Desulfobacteraceae bacterium]|nr:helix-turn-helix transcriptional regulator [Desulfobacteraceae bacterium]
MDNKGKDTMDKDVKKKFLELIKEHSQPWWSEKLGVSQAVISSSWTAGKMPRVETLMKILKIKGVSPSWLFFNSGPKYIKDMDNQDISVSRNRDTHLKIQVAENELIELREKVKNLELLLKQQQLCMIVPFLKEDEAKNEKATVLPILTLMRMLNDVLYKSFELTVNKENAEKIIDWIKNNFDSNQFKTSAALKDIEKIIS